MFWQKSAEKSLFSEISLSLSLSPPSLLLSLSLSLSLSLPLAHYRAVLTPVEGMRP